MTHRSARVSESRLVEVAGVAGAGKSTLARAICTEPGFEVGGFIHTRTPAHMVNVMTGLPRLLPVLLADPVRSPRISWPEFKLLVYVTRWLPILRREARRHGGITVLDQGPIYALVRLRAEGKPFTMTPAFDRWCNEMLGEWASELSRIVWLDAGDHVLWDRINGRRQSHKKKGEDADEGLRFITKYRSSFEDILGRIEAVEPSKVLRFGTDRATPEELATTIRPLLTADARP
jgi:AAA domain